MIDCDGHQNFNSLRDLEQWLDPAFRDYVEVGGYGGFALPNYPWVACRARTTSCCASLETGSALFDERVRVRAFDARLENGRVVLYRRTL